MWPVNIIHGMVKSDILVKYGLQFFLPLKKKNVKLIVTKNACSLIDMTYDFYIILFYCRFL